MPPTPLRHLFLVHPSERAPLFWAAAYHFCLLFGYYLLRPFRDELGIRGDLDDLPWLWTGTTAAMLLAGPPFWWLVSRLPRRRFIPLVYRFAALNLLVFYALFARLPAAHHLAIGYAFYIWLSVYNLFAVSVFWGFMADLFRPDQGKRLFGAIGVGGTLGAVCGSAAVSFLTGGVTLPGGSTLTLDALTLLLLTIVLIELAVQCVRRLVRIHHLDAAPAQGTAPPGHARDEPCSEGESPGCAQKQDKSVAPSNPPLSRQEHGPGTRLSPPAPSPEPGRSVFAGLLLVARSPYLQALALYMLLFTITSSFIYYEQGRITQSAYPAPDPVHFPEAAAAANAARRAFLARIDLAVNLLTLVTQLFLTGHILTRLGLAAGLALLPILTLLGFTVFGMDTALPIIGVFAVFQVARRAMHYAVDRPAREVLYTVLGPDEKYKSKNFIDTFVYRAGDLIGIWTASLLSSAGRLVVWSAIPLSLIWLTTGLFLAARQKSLARAARRPAR